MAVNDNVNFYFVCCDLVEQRALSPDHDKDNQT